MNDETSKYCGAEGSLLKVRPLIAGKDDCF